MGDYIPPFTITNEILSYVSSVSEKIGRITATSSLESKPHLRRNNRIRSIHASLKIEANSLSLGQVRDVINGKTGAEIKGRFPQKLFAAGKRQESYPHDNSR